MKTVVVTFGPPIPQANGTIGNLRAVYERIATVDIEKDQLILKTEDGAQIIWNWPAVLNVSIDPHGSIVKPQTGVS